MLPKQKEVIILIFIGCKDTNNQSIMQEKTQKRAILEPKLFLKRELFISQ